MSRPTYRGRAWGPGLRRALIQNGGFVQEAAVEYWVFRSQSEADAAQQEAFETLPPDTDMDGRIAEHQVTERWAEVRPVTAPLFYFQAKPGMAIPASAFEVESDTPL